MSEETEFKLEKLSKTNQEKLKATAEWLKANHKNVPASRLDWQRLYTKGIDDLVAAVTD